MSVKFEKSELEILLQVITRYTEQMVTVAENLKKVAELQEKANARLYNGMAKDISVSINSTIDNYEEERGEQYKTIANSLTSISDNIRNIDKIVEVSTSIALTRSSITRDITVAKWFIAAIATLVIIVAATVRVIDAKHPASIIKSVILDTTQEIVGR